MDAAPAKSRIHKVTFCLLSAWEIENVLGVMEVTTHLLYDNGNALITNASIAASVVNHEFGTAVVSDRKLQQQQNVFFGVNCDNSTAAVESAPKLTSNLMALTNSTNVKNRIEMENGLLDYRLGSSNRKRRCKTCGLVGDRKGCPGHFGYIKLNYPIYFVGTLNWCKTILNLVCHFCSRLLVSKEAVNKSLIMGEAKWETMTIEQRVDKLSALRKPRSSCQCLAKSPILEGLPQPTYTVDKLRVLPVWTATILHLKKLEEAKRLENPEHRDLIGSLLAHMKRPFLAPDAWKILNAMHPEDLDFMGCVVEEHSGCGHPRNTILSSILVESTRLRPTAVFDKGRIRSQNEKTRKYVEIILANNAAGDAIYEATRGAHRRITPELACIISSADLQHLYATSIAELEWQVSTMYNNEMKNIRVDRQRSGKPCKSLQAAFKGKEGRIRQNGVSKRCNGSSRATITANATLDVDQLGVPEKIYLTHTVPEKVTPWNKAELTQAVLVGPKALGGASSIIMPDGTEIDLAYFPGHKTMTSLPLGTEVARYMHEGQEVGILNRQPTLHKMSMQALRMVPMKGSTFRINLAITAPYNADFDGDEMNLHIPQAAEEQVEARMLMNVKSNLLSGQSSKMTMFLVQDAILGAWRMTHRSTFFTRAQAVTILTQLKHFTAEAFARIGEPAIRKPVELYTGKQVYSAALFPSCISYTKWRGGSPSDSKAPSPSSPLIDDVYDDYILVRNGRLLSGRLCKATIGPSSGSIVYAMTRGSPYNTDDGGGSMYSKDPKDYVVKFLSEAQRIVDWYLVAHENFSIGPGDLLLPKQARAQIKSVIESTLRHDTAVHTRVATTREAQRIEDRVKEPAREKILKRLLPKCAEIASGYLNSGNGCKDVVDCGSKGSSINIGQLTSCVGQQMVEGSRLTNGRLPCFPIGTSDAEAQGLVRESLLHGLNPASFFFHAQAGREGLVDTAVKTAHTGYIQRRIIRGCENASAEYDGTVRNWNGRVLQTNYGGDGWLTEALVKCTLPYLELPSEDAVRSKVAASFCFSDYAKDYLTSVPMRPRYRRSREYYAKNVAPVLQAQADAVAERAIALRLQRRTPYYKIGREAITECYFPSNYAADLRSILASRKKRATAAVMMLDAKTICAFLEMLQAHIARVDKVAINVERDYYLTASLSIKWLLSAGVTEKEMDLFCRLVLSRHQDGVCPPGASVGMMAGESVGEPTTQLTLNTFHLCGVQTTKLVTSGVPRMTELTALQKLIKVTSMTIAFDDAVCKDEQWVRQFANMLPTVSVADIVVRQRIIYDPLLLPPLAPPPAGGSSLLSDKLTAEETRALADMKSVMNFFIRQPEGDSSSSGATKMLASMVSRFAILLELDHIRLFDCQKTPADIASVLRKKVDSLHPGCIVFSDYRDGSGKEAWYIYMRIPSDTTTVTRREKNSSSSIAAAAAAVPMDSSGAMMTSLLRERNACLLKFRSIVSACIFSGVKGITGAYVRQGTHDSEPEYVIDTLGSNIADIFAMDHVDIARTTSNSLYEIESTLGIDAAADALFSEYKLTMESANSAINDRHFSLIVDLQATEGVLKALTRHGISKDHAPLTQISFEESVENMYRAAIFNKVDYVADITSNVMLGQNVPVGTGKVGFAFVEARGGGSGGGSGGSGTSTRSARGGIAAASACSPHHEQHPNEVVMSCTEDFFPNRASKSVIKNLEFTDQEECRDAYRSFFVQACRHPEAYPLNVTDAMHKFAQTIIDSDLSDEREAQRLRKAIVERVFNIMGVAVKDTASSAAVLPFSMPVDLTRRTFKEDVCTNVPAYSFREKTDGTRYYLLLTCWKKDVPVACMINRAGDVFFVDVAGPRILFEQDSLYDTELVGEASSKILILDIIQHAGTLCTKMPWIARYDIIHKIFSPIYDENLCFEFSEGCTPAVEYHLKQAKIPLSAYNEYVIALLQRAVQQPQQPQQQQSSILAFGGGAGGMSPIVHQFVILHTDRSNRMTLRPKPCYSLRHLNAFLMNSKFLTKVEFPCDGLILQRLDLGIKPYTDSNLHKWKPAELLTIDIILVAAAEGGRRCYLASDSGLCELDQMHYMQVNGQTRNVTSVDISWGKQQLQADDNAAAAIVECKIAKFDTASGALTLSPVRIRTDKATPNNVRAASAVLQCLYDNISLVELGERTFVSPKQHHTLPPTPASSSYSHKSSSHADPSILRKNIPNFRPASPCIFRVSANYITAPHEANGSSQQFCKPPFRPASPNTCPKIIAISPDYMSTQVYSSSFHNNIAAIK